jgi:hypothetical protein
MGKLPQIFFFARTSSPNWVTEPLIRGKSQDPDKKKAALQARRGVQNAGYRLTPEN